MQAKDIIARAHALLQDDTGVRWPATELVAYLNDAQRELSRLRPDQTAQRLTVALEAGYRQVLPAGYHTLIDVHANAGGRRSAVTKVDVRLLDAVDPNWRSRPGGSSVRHYAHDLREPAVFLVYPPVMHGVQVEITASAYPANVPEPSGAAASSVTGSISVPDMWADALLNYIMYRAFMKDAEFGGNAQLATAYLQAFNTAVGSQLQSAVAVTQGG